MDRDPLCTRLVSPRRLARHLLWLGVALAAAACAGAGPGADFDARDPYEETNRSFHKLNLRVDRNVLRPAARAYDTVTPATIQHLLGNAFNQLDSVNDFANYLLQGEAEAAGTALGRVVVNTVLGAGGLLDPATEFGLPKEDTDFGVTLGKHGVEEGAYLVLPFLGPSTTRDLGGRVGDLAFDPFTYTGLTGSNLLNTFSPVYTGAEIVHDRAINADLIDEILYQSEDSYVSLRTVYLQRRDRLISGDETGVETLPDIFDEEAE